MAVERTLRGIAIGCIFLVPFVVLYVANSLFFPFITGKGFAFRILVEVAASAWLALAFVFPHYRPRRSWILYAFTAFLLVMAAADALGIGPLKSFWSNFERMEGWVTLAHLFLFFLVVSSLFTERLWRWWWHVSLAVSVAVSIYGLLQLAGILAITQGDVRLTATLGNATYLGVYLLFHVFIAALLLARSFAVHSATRPGVVALYGSAIALNAFVLFFTATRGAILGLLGGALLAALLYGLQRPHTRFARYALVGALVCASLGAGIWAARDTAFVRGVEPLHRLASISFSEAALSARVMNAQMAFEGFKERPLLGWGQEHFAVVFDRYYDPDLYASEPWFDRVHNVVFDWLVAGGILGLLAYLALFFSGLWVVWRSGAFSAQERAILSGLFAGYFFYNLFTFDNITSYILFVGMLAWLHHRAATGEHLLAQFSLPRGALPVFAACAVVLAWGGAWWVNADALAQNRAIIRGLSAGANASAGVEYFMQAVAYNSYGTQEAREHFAQVAMAARGASTLPVEVKQQFLQNAASQMARQAEAAPMSARFPLFLGVLLDLYGLHDEAKLALERALELSPRKQTILFQLGQNAFARGAEEEGLAFFKQAYELAPEFRDARLLYAIAAVESGEARLSDEILAPLVETGAAADARLASTYAARGEFKKIVSLWSAYVEKHPEDMQARFTLGVAYYAVGNVDTAIAVLEQIAKDAPGAKQQAEGLIREMRAGTLKVE